MNIKAYLLNIIAVYTFVIFPLFCPVEVYSKNNLKSDTEPPTILHEISDNVFEGNELTIKAVIKDNYEVKKAILNYRNKGELDYKKARMDAEPRNEFTVKIALKPNLSRKLEYYIVSLDKEGNISHKGFAVDPLIINIKGDFNDLELAQLTASIAPWYKKWWLWAIVGSVVTGSVAAMAASKGDSGDQQKGSINW